MVEVEDVPSAAMLKADHAFAVVASGTVWVWLGKYTPLDLRRIAFEVGAETAQQHNLPSNAPVQVRILS